MDRTTNMEQEAEPLFYTGYLAKMRGQARSPLQVNAKDALTGFVGCFFTISILVTLTNMTSSMWLMAPFGASCVLAFGAWNAPLSQPRNIIGGHAIATTIGLITYHLIGDAPWAIGLAVGLVTAVMMLTKTVHPPAGADPLVVILGGYSWSYLVIPVISGSLIIVLFALIINNLRKNRNYPTFWY